MTVTVNTDIGGAAIGGQGGSGSGDVVGPASSTDNAVVRFDGTTGKLVQDSAVTIADTTGDITAGKYNTVAISGASTPALTVTGTATISGTNTGDQNLFSTVAVSGQSNVVADTTSDTLTLAAGSGITITTDASTDTVTIAASASGGGWTLLENKAWTGVSSYTFQTIPSTVTEFDVRFDGASFDSAVEFTMQLGSIAGGVEASGYEGTYAGLASASQVASNPSTSSVQINTDTGVTLSGTVSFKKLGSGNTWIWGGTLSAQGIAQMLWVAGRKTLANTLDKIQVAASGAGTGDAGNIAVWYRS